VSPLIELRDGTRVIVDEVDSAMVKKHAWTAHDKGGGSVYISRHERIGNRFKRHYLHREIVGAAGDQQVDHINGNTFDNRRCNLRICSPTQNAQNKGPLSRNKSGMKGVDFSADKSRNRPWRATIFVGGKKIFLGRFPTKEEAAAAYDRASLRHHGEFARTNAAGGGAPAVGGTPGRHSKRRKEIKA
jgi:hypothetical protein